MLDFVASYHCIQFQEKLMNQTCKKGQKPRLRPNFGPNVVPQNFVVDFASTRCHALMQAIIVCNFKEN